MGTMKLTAIVLMVSLAASGAYAIVFTDTICQSLAWERKHYARFLGRSPIDAVLAEKMAYCGCLPVTQRPVTVDPWTPSTTTFKPTFIVDPNNPCIGEFWEKDHNGDVVTIRRNICTQTSKTW